MKKEKIKINDLNSFFIDDILNKVKLRRKARKEQKQQLNSKKKKS